MKIKNISDKSLTALEKELNKFLDENPRIEIISINVANEAADFCGDLFVVYIVYK